MMSGTNVIELVWLVNRDGMFEKDWMDYLFQDLSHIHITEIHDDLEYKFPIFIFNASFAYEEYLTEFNEERIPFGVIHLSDETLGNTCNYLDLDSCMFAIRNYHHPIHSTHAKVTTIGLGYKHGFHNPTHDAPPALRSPNPWFHWCFIGAVHHQARHDAVSTFLQVKPYLLKVSNGGFNSASLSIAEYKNTMVLSKFALCPIGQGNLDTFRIYEAMEAGCIPVVLTRTKEQPYYPSYWHALFSITSGDSEISSPIPLVMADTWGECLRAMESLLQNPIMYYDLQQKMTIFWEKQKQKWRLQIADKVKLLVTAQ